MIQNITQSFKNYIFSDYDIDRQKPQGFWSIKGRLINLIDIPSEVAKTVVVTPALFAIALYKVGLSGLVLAFKVIPKAIFSIVPGTDSHYWKEHAAANLRDSKELLIQFGRFAAFGISYFYTHVTMPFANIIGCTIAPDFARILRLDNARAFQCFVEHSKIEQFHRDAGIRRKTAPLNIYLTPLNLPLELRMPMFIIVNKINESLLNKDHTVINDRFFHGLAPKSLPPKRYFSVFGRSYSGTANERRIYEYMNWRTGENTGAIHFRNADRKTAEETVMGQCLKRLVEEKAIYGFDKFEDSFIIQA